MERVAAAVVGGGAVGCAVARELARAGIGEVVVLERRRAVGEVQSGRNSGVVHAGIYYATGSNKARLCVEANPLVYELCGAHGVACERVGKLVVATCDAEIPALEAIFAQARANGVPGVRILTREETRRLEPNVEVPAALHVPTTGIVDAAGYVRALAGDATAAGAHVFTSFEVTDIAATSTGFEVRGVRAGAEEVFEAAWLINAAGLDCDVVARMVDPSREIEVVGLRGEYCRLDRRKRPGIWLARMNVYPVPEPLELGAEAAMMVGAHLTPTFAMGRDGSVGVGDSVSVGPEFRLARSKVDYERERMPREVFLDRVRRYFPALELEDLELDCTGIMVHLPGATDWLIEHDRRHPRCVQLLGIDSPGLTGSLAIGARVRAMILG